MTASERTAIQRSGLGATPFLATQMGLMTMFASKAFVDTLAEHGGWVGEPLLCRGRAVS